MNRKFRAWDKKLKLFSYFSFLTCIPAYGYESEFIIQHFTGLKDKDKKEIFEGDIINRAGIWYLVEYGEDEASYILKARNGEWVYLSDFTNLEIIGHVFEIENF